MIDLPTTRSQLFSELAVAAVMAVFVAGMCLALVWIAPLELFPPRVR